MTKEPTLQLYGYWRSMAAYRVRVALNLKNIAVHEIPINLGTDEQRQQIALDAGGQIRADPHRRQINTDHRGELRDRIA